MTTSATPARTTAQQLLAGLRIAAATVAGAVLLTASLPRKLEIHAPLAPQLVAYGVLVALLGAEIVGIVQRRDWNRARLPMLVLVLGASALSTWSLAPEYLLTSTDWSFGSSGWLGVVLLFGRPLPELATFLALNLAITVTRVLAVHGANLDILLGLTAGAVGTVGFPLACGIASTVVRRIADSAEQASARAAEIRTAEAVATGLFEARETRLARLDIGVEQLLRGLASGELDPEDPEVRRSCDLEAARMRRFLAEADDADDADDRLLYELRQGADVAERRNVLVEFERAGRWPTPPDDARPALADGILAGLTAARRRARVSVIGIGPRLSVSVTADGGNWAPPLRTHPSVSHIVVSTEDQTWIESTWTDEPRSPSSTTTPSPEGA
ncbi:hypothetical protein [Pseudonocardia oroxyli]|uniref:hypothetical protein n=1 Tax=Pseudonocardia oroxyli TaxID=366584 RepID=UPI0015A22EBC|nr:hypothetical protein [Pseudonocardia oroxyli]